jgi:hypothetical protein
MPPDDTECPEVQMTRADQARHLIVSWAACDDPQWWTTLQSLPKSASVHLKELLRGMQTLERFGGEPHRLNPPHERALARAWGWGELADGLLPWAAHQAAAAGLGDGPWGWVSLCHWAMGREQASLSDPADLTIRADESDALLAAMRPFFESEGLHLHPVRAGRWLVRGEAMAVPTASLDRAIGRDVDPWLPASTDARLLRRLQNEMQMLLYTHPVNDARAARRESPINSLWFSGTGRLGASPASTHDVHLSPLLASAAMSGNWPAYVQAWQRLDEEAIGPLLERQRSGQTVRLSLCGERGWVTLETGPQGWRGRLARWWRPSAWPALLEGGL